MRALRRLLARAALFGCTMRLRAARSSREAASRNASAAVSGLAAERTFLSAVRSLERNWRLRAARAALLRILFSADFTLGKCFSSTGSGATRRGFVMRKSWKNRKPKNTRPPQYCQPLAVTCFDKLPGHL